MGTETERETLSSGGSLSDLVVGFFEEIEGNAYPESDGEGEGSTGNDAERKAFWETQRQLLHVRRKKKREALSKTSSAEKRIRAATEDIVGAMRSEDLSCSCSNRTVRDCRSCSSRHVADRLRCAGFNSALCKSKWRRSPDIPSGEHSYVDVVVESKKGPAARVVIELNFRAEFEMARASGEYSGLVASLPEVFVGKAERLKGAVKVMCAAAKKCMKDNNMHIAPWRKHKYMQAKWLAAPERADPGFFPATAEPAGGGTAERQRKVRASLLTFDLHRTVVVVEVV